MPRKTIKTTIAAICVAAATALSMGAANASTHAGVNGISATPDYTSNGVSGYLVNRLGTSFRNVHTYVHTSVQTEDLTTGNSVGEELCNNNTGLAAQEGLVYQGAGVFEVEWGFGTIAANAAAPDDLCEGGLLTTEFRDGTLIASVPVGDTVELRLHYQDGVLDFQAQIVGSNHGSEAHTKFVGADHHFWEAGIGVQGDDTVLSAPAANTLVSFSQSRVTSTDGTNGDLGNNANWTAIPVDSSATGNPPALIEANGLAWGHFAELSGTASGL